ncbi:aminodeoxychorismate lyase [Chitinispirillum alkaliphilum]|nr:aminodeoxychorismate lyase [Chitinispirillum alkaliphilum]
MFKKIMLVILLIFLIFSATFYYFLLPMGRSEETVEMVIGRGKTLRSIAQKLENENVVTSADALILFLKITGTDKKIQAGRFVFNRGEGAWSVSRKLMKAEAVDVAVTINEGLTVEQTAQAIAASKLEIDSARFVQLCYDSAYARSVGIEQNSLEGYLFPDTYRFSQNSTEEDIIKRMVNRFLQIYRLIEVDSAVAARYSRHEIITLASIVEKEATLKSERGLIAGVFHNRLIKGYPLGADPTVRYIFRKFDGPLYVSELNVDNPYNTRRFRGLPPGPICSPGRGSIQATATPEETDKLYFVAKWDGTGAHDFSRTYREHNRKKLEYRRLNEMRRRENRRR